MATAIPEPVSAPFEGAEVLKPSGGLLRFTTAGSVDDGKSTLIGRLLYDSQSVYEDQMASVRKSKINRSSGPIDFSLLTDGLRAEREQGITIDVAYRYFSTPRRKFIIADTPGHEQYTRNMATGASTADAAVVLLDATKGVLPQSRRHAYIANLLGVRHIVAAVNKMDLADYSQEVFERIAKDFREFTELLGMRNVYSVPVSALEGDNVVRRSSKMDWFDGPSLLEFLETLPVSDASINGPLRFPVQYVIRPDANFRGFAGQIASGVLRPGTSVVALPSGVKTRVKKIVAYNGEVEEAGPGSSVNVTLEEEIDISRGDLLAEEEDRPQVANEFQAVLVWMHSDPLDTSKEYLLKHTTRTIRARLKRVRDRLNINTLEHEAAATLEMNDIGVVEIRTTLPLLFDAYLQNRTMGSFILIDPIHNATLAAGIIERAWTSERSLTAKHQGRVTSDERRLRFGHPAAAVWLPGRSRASELVERTLFDEGWFVQLAGPADFFAKEIGNVARVLHHAGQIGVFSPPDDSAKQRDEVRGIFGAHAFFEVESVEEGDDEIAARLLSRLRKWRDTHANSKGEKE
jgi:sulfate adenylyltransferase subunit 1